jgi:hypothetical protein
MKKTVILLLAIGALALGTVWLAQTRKSTQAAPAEVEKLKAELAEKSQQVRELEVARERAEAQSRNLAQLSDEIASHAQERELALSKQVVVKEAVLQESATNGVGNKADGGVGKMLGEMMKDPEMKKMIRQQQSLMMGQLYDPFIKRVNLNPEEAGRFKEILTGGMENSVELASSVFGAGGATNRAEALKSIAAQQKEQEANMKVLLGDDRYAQYQDYQQTVGERTQLNQFRQQYTGADGISEEQTEALLTMMREEKKSVAATSGASFPGQNPSDMQALLKEGETEKLISAQETVNQNVYGRASQILTPAQLESFARYQTNQLQMFRMGLNMARKFMGDGSTSGTTP